MVFLAHYDDIGLFGTGVNIFFVLSGFLITGILLDTRDQPHRLRNFYVRRTLRIFPLYYGIFLGILLLTPVFHWSWNSAWLLWPAYIGNHLIYMHPWLPESSWRLVMNAQLVGTQGITLYLGHFWSLCVEEQFYLLWPWIVFTLPRRALLWICSTVTLAMPFVRIYAAQHLSPADIHGNLLFRTLPFQIDSLLLGGLLALLLRGEHRATLVRVGRHAANIGSIAGLLFVYCCVDFHIPALHQPFPLSVGNLTWQLSLINILSAALILGSLQPGAWVYRFFHLRPMRWLGRISYSAYVLHDIPHRAYLDLAHQISELYWRPIFILIGCTCTLAGAALSYRFFERPFLKLKDRWTARA
jgi:peptidoglycan/LPS O-acetylase OafA/YrhL